MAITAFLQHPDEKSCSLWIFCLRPETGQPVALMIDEWEYPAVAWPSTGFHVKSPDTMLLCSFSWTPAACGPPPRGEPALMHFLDQERIITPMASWRNTL